MLKEFKDFAMKGNVVDMAVGIIIGASFVTIVNSLVADVIMPPLLLGGIDFSNMLMVLKEGLTTSGPYSFLAAAKAAGTVTINYGQFLNHILTFLIVAFAVFLLVNKIVTNLRNSQSQLRLLPENALIAQQPYQLKQCAVRIVLQN